MPEALNIPIRLNDGVTSSKNSVGAQGKAEYTDSTESVFSTLVDRISAEKNMKTGKKLPEAGAEMTGKEMVNVDTERDNSLNAADTIIQSAGHINLVLGQGEVSDDSLLDFMNEQGFSRSKIASLLTQSSRELSKSEAIAGPLQTTTDNWLKTKGIDATLAKSSEEILDRLSPKELKYEILATGLVDQLQLNKIASKPSLVIELIANKSHAGNLLNSPNSKSLPVEDTLNLAELLEVDLPEDSGDASSSSSRENESPSLFSNANRLKFDGVPPQEQARDFRQFVTEHLRRAETLHQLTDRLGTFVARQVTAQLGKGSWSLDLTLHPSELGSIKVDMEMTERGLEATFRATHSTTRDLLMDSMPRLKQWFEEGGINVAYSGLSQDSDTGNAKGGSDPDSFNESQGAHENGLEPDQEQEQIADGEINSGRLDIRV